MQQDALTLYKLIILFMLDKVDFPLTNAQISNFILEKEYTDYFNIQKAISELFDADFIVIKTIRNSSHLEITEAGKEVLGYCEKDISDGIKSETLEYLQKNRFKLRDEVSTIADYFQVDEQNYQTRCYIKEGETTLIEINLTVSSETEAETVCRNWENENQDIYAYLIQNLLMH